jgi:cobaltochelatase CobS
LGANTVAEGGDLTLDDNGGEVVERHPDFRWIATANTFGNGSANYQRNVQDAAFLDRAFLMEMKYLPREVEVSMLQQRFPEMDVRLLGQYVDVANAVRAAYTGESAKHGIELTMSTRSLIRWVQTSIDFKPMASRGISPIHKALNHSIALRAEPTTQMFLHEEVQRMFGTTYKPN